MISVFIWKAERFDKCDFTEDEKSENGNFRQILAVIAFSSAENHCINGKREKSMKFIMSYSCGKDSTLALHYMIRDGHEPVGLLVMVNQEMDRSWFHGVDWDLLKKISESLQIPLIPCVCKGEEYHIALEKGLEEGIKLGAEACVFGDIDIEDNAQWCKQRCDAKGLKWIFPLWHRGRKELVQEFIDLGYTALIKCVKNDILPQKLLGKPLDEESIALMQQAGADICGENGEYHTIAVNGPIFNIPVETECKEILDFGTISAINIIAK